MSKKGQEKKKVKPPIPKASDTATALVPFQLSEINKRLSLCEKVAGVPVVVDMKRPEDLHANFLKMPIARNLSNGINLSKFRSRAFTTQKPYKTVVWAQVQVGTPANTAYNTVSLLYPNQSTDAKALAVVFDEVRCVGFRLEQFISTYATATGVPTYPGTSVLAAVAFDPATAGVYANTQDMMSAQYRLGPFVIALTAIPFLSKRQILNVRIPPTVDPGLVTDLLGSNWVAASDTNLLVGYLKPFITAAGAGISVGLFWWIGYEMEYAYRT